MVLCLPVTSLPARSSGCPRSLIWPLSASVFIQAIHVCMLFCICSGDPIAARLAAFVLRNRYTNSLMMTPPGVDASGAAFGLPTVRRLSGSEPDILTWEPAHRNVVGLDGRLEVAYIT